MARIHELVELLQKAPDEVFVQPHNVPDPDAIASSFGLRELLVRLGVPCEIVYEDEIEKANSVTMLETFGIEMKHSADGHGIGGGHDSMAGGFIKHDSFPESRSVDTFTRVRTVSFVEQAKA